MTVTNLYCPVCGSKYSEYQEKCGFCAITLNSRIMNLGQLDEKLSTNFEAEKRIKREKYLQASIISSFEKGRFNNTLFTRLSGESQEVHNATINSYQEKLFSEINESTKNIQNIIDDISLSRQSDAYFLDIDFELITFVWVSLDTNDEFTIKTNELKIRDLIPLPTEEQKFNVALAGGYINLNSDNIRNKIRNLIGSLSNNTHEIDSIHICTSVLDSEHADQIIKTIHKDYQIADPIYCRSDENRLIDLIGSLCKKTPLHYSFSLLVAQIDENGKITQKYETLFPANQKDMSRKICVNLSSRKSLDGEIYFGIQQRDSKGKLINEKVYEIDGMKNNETMPIDFSLNGRNDIDIAVNERLRKALSQISLGEIINDVPTEISLTAQKLDLVILLDLIISQELFNDRINLIKDLLHQIEDHSDVVDIRYNIIGYGDYPEGKFSTQYPIQDTISTKQTDWLEIHNQDNWSQIFKIDPAKRDFESALDEALYLVNGLKWRQDSERIMVAIGQRPPYPQKPIAGVNQSGSRYDWESILTDIRNKGIKSYSVICPIYWQVERQPHFEPYSNKFWHEFTTENEFSFDRNKKEIISKLDNGIMSHLDHQQGQLSIPVLIERM